MNSLGRLTLKWFMAGLVFYWVVPLCAATEPDVSSPLPFAVTQLEYPDYARADQRRSDGRYCEGLLNDLKTVTNTQILQPVYQAQTIEQLAQSKKFGRCEVSALIESEEAEARIWESIKDLPKEERKQYVTTWTMTKAFSLYEADIDRNPKNGKELILYGGGSTSNNGEEGGFSSFVVPNLKTCKPRCAAQVWDIVYNQDATVGVIEYRKEALIYATKYYEKEKLHSFTFQRLMDHKPIFYSICTFTAKDNLSPNPKPPLAPASGPVDAKPLQ